MQVTDSGRYKLVDGYLSYTPDRIWQDYYANPVLRSLLAIQGELHIPANAIADQRVAGDSLRSLDASAIVVFDSPQQGAAITYLETLLAARGERAGSCTVFAVPTNEPVPAAK